MKVPSHLAALALATLLAPTLAGCAALGFSDSAGNGSRPTGGGGSLDDGRVAVSAAFYPLAWVAEQVGGDRVEVSQLTTPGAEPHDLELTVGETADVARADLVLLEGGFQPAVDDAVAQDPRGTLLDVRDVVDLEPVEEHADEHEDDEHDDHDDLAGLDPHFWQDPLLLADYADAVAGDLGRIDAAHADGYAARAQRLRTRLERLDTGFARGLGDCERDVVLVNHDAFGYLARYGLEMEPISGLSPDAEPAPADLARIEGTARETGVTTVFSERLVSARTAEALASDLGIDSAVLDPVEGLSSATADDDYLSLMRGNLAALRTANGCR